MKTPQITFYDFENVEISRISNYLNGFFSNPKKHLYKFSVKRATPPILMHKSTQGEWRRFLNAIGIFDVRHGGKRFYFCIDRRDHSSNYMGEGYQLPLLKEVRYYFKTNYNQEAIHNDPELYRFRDKIFPAGPTFPIRINNMLPFLPRIISDKRARMDRLHLMRKVPHLDELRRMRQIKPDLDVFFVMGYYHNPNQKEQNEFRYEIIRELENHDPKNKVIGFVTKKKLPEKYARFAKNPYSMKEYLYNLARSKVTIYTRGPHNGISSKFGQLLALGKPVIGETIFNNKKQLYANKHFDEQFAYESPKEIAQHVIMLLKNPLKLSQLAVANAQTFDTQFTPEINAANIIETLFLDSKKETLTNLEEDSNVRTIRSVEASPEAY
jgi:hypothetical protein